MNHRDDDRYERERDWNRDRHREGRESEGREEGSQASFHSGGYGFDETQSGRSSGEYAPPYGQREPYATGGGWRQSRYSESQYGQGPQGQGEYDPRRNWGGRGAPYRSSPDRGDGDRGHPYGDPGRGGNWQYGNRGSPGYGGPRQDSDRYSADRYGGDDYSSARRYGVGYTGSADRSRSFGADRFARGDEPRYYGTGYYAEGTSAFGGGFGEERWRSHPSSTGWLRESEQGSRFFGGGSERQHREERPGLLRRMFGRGPKGYQRSDERLREDISERLMHSEDIDSSEVMVLVAAGKVTLEGTVPDRHMKHAIEDLVDACPGVQDIDNRVRVDRNAGGSSGASSASTTQGSTGSTGTTSASSGVVGTSGATRTTRKDS